MLPEDDTASLVGTMNPRQRNEEAMLLDSAVFGQKHRPDYSCAGDGACPVPLQVHRRVQKYKHGDAGGKLINRVQARGSREPWLSLNPVLVLQDCHPALRADYRERWYPEEEPTPGPPPPARLPFKDLRVSSVSPCVVLHVAVS